MANQCTKFEVSRFSRYEAMNGGAECRKWSGFGQLGILRVTRNVTIRESAYDFPGLSCGVVCVILRLALLVELRLVTDGRTDGRIDTGPWLVPRMHSIAR